MLTQMRALIAAAVMSGVSAICGAQMIGQSGPNAAHEMQEAPPVERAYANQSGGAMSLPSVSQSTPIPGVIVRVAPQSDVQQVSSEPQTLELRVERGVANVNVHKPAKDTLILVDLPGGQTQVLKDGLYTFNAETNTTRVLKGEALAFPAGAEDAKPLKVKEFNKVIFNGADVKPHQFVPYDAQLDVLPGAVPSQGGAAYGYGPYGDGFYGGYPYYAYGAYSPWGYPYYPYGYGYYPYGGVGYGYYGGFHGGYRGGGFHRGR